MHIKVTGWVLVGLGVVIASLREAASAVPFFLTDELAVPCVLT